MTTLAATITATQRTITLSGDVSAATPSRLYVIEDEIVELERFGFVPPSPTYPFGINSSVWFVKRGHDGSTPATHASGTTVYAAIGGYNRSASLATASPVVSGGGGSQSLLDVLAVGNVTTNPNYATMHGANNGDVLGGWLKLDDAETAGVGSGGSVTLEAGDSGVGPDGAALNLVGGSEGSFNFNPGAIIVTGAAAAAHGLVVIKTNNLQGPGALVSDGTYLHYVKAAHVANGSTVDQLRDALIAAGLMAAS